MSYRTKTDEDDFIMISALQHYVFCPRQCALIHIEQVWGENRFTAEGRILHERVHEQGGESRGEVRIERGVPLRSLRLGMSGVADVVEFHRMPGERRWQPFPVEYKRGKPKPDHCDAVQLCAQAMCLEEILKVEVPEGALYYGKPHRRQDIIFDDKLRRETEDAARQVHELIASGQTPAAQYGPKCDSCSLMEQCMPRTVETGKSVKRYLSSMVRTHEETS